MNTQRQMFEYWAIRNNKPCTKDKDLDYTDKDTQSLYECWIQSTDYNLQESFEKYHQSKLNLREFDAGLYKLSAISMIKGEFRNVKSVIELLDSFETYRKEDSVNHTFGIVNHKVSLILSAMDEIENLVGIGELVTGLHAYNHLKIKAKIQTCIDKISKAPSWGYKLETDVAKRLFDSAFVLDFNGLRFNDKVIQFTDNL